MVRRVLEDPANRPPLRTPDPGQGPLASIFPMTLLVENIFMYNECGAGLELGKAGSSDHRSVS